MTSIAERNQQILQMRRNGVSQKEVARKFKLSPVRIYLIEKQDADRSLLERRAKVREEIQAIDDPDRMWPVSDLVNALCLIVVTRKRLMDHFTQVGQQQMSLRGLMDMCSVTSGGGLSFVMPPVFEVYGIGKKGYWSLVNALTFADLGRRCEDEWQKRLAQIKKVRWCFPNEPWLVQSTVTLSPPGQTGPSGSLLPAGKAHPERVGFDHLYGKNPI